MPLSPTPEGGPAHLVENGVDGWVVPDEDFPHAIAATIAEPGRWAAMCEAARARAEKASWEAVFESVYEGYEAMLGEERERRLTGT